MHLTTLRTPVVRLVTVGVCVALLAGCSDKPTPTAATTDTRSLTVLTDHRAQPGDEFALGQKAIVTWPASKTKSSLVSLRVTKVQRGKVSDLKQFPLSDAAKASTVYYVSVGVTNTGRGDLGGSELTLYGQVSDALVVPPVTLNSPFDRCSNPPLPKRFAKNATAHVCLVMLAPDHGKISAVQWRQKPSGPISWLVHARSAHKR